MSSFSKCTYAGFACLSNGWGPMFRDAQLPYSLAPPYVPDSGRQEMPEPEPEPEPEPVYHHDDLFPRSPIVEPFPIPHSFRIMHPPGFFDRPRRRYPKPRVKIIPYQLLAKLGIHCYNLQKGTNFQLLYPLDCTDNGILGSMLTDHDPGLNYPGIPFESRVLYNEVEKKRCSTTIITLCRFQPPQTPVVEGDDDLCAAFDRLAVDDFFKDDMPDWVPDTASDDLHPYYEMKESDVGEHHPWLHLYAALAFFTTSGPYMSKLRDAQPFELTKVIVQTRQDVESKKKATADNAIFYIAFKSRGRDYNAIIRRTMDGTPEHMSLEVKCFKMPKSTVMDMD